MEEGDEPVLSEAVECHRRRSKLEAEVIPQETISSEAADIGSEDSRREAEAIAQEDIFSLYETADSYRGAEISISVDPHTLEKSVEASYPGKQVGGSPAVEVTPIDADDDAIEASTDERSTDVGTGLAHSGVRRCYACRGEQAQHKCEHWENANKD